MNNPLILARGKQRDETLRDFATLIAQPRYSLSDARMVK